MKNLLNIRLIQRHRRRARALLYLLPLMLTGLCWLVIQILSLVEIDNSWRDTDYRIYESVRLFQRYLQINTSYPTGNEIPGAEFLARELAKEGIEVHVERLGHRNANMWAILEGRDEKALVLHNHIDVDPIQNLDAWAHPPFSGLINLPFVYGRGAFDMKGVAIAQLMALKEIQREGLPLRRSLIFLATGDEERDSWHGTRWVLRQHPDLIRRFDVVLTEGGAVEATDVDKVKYWGTETRQKLFVEMRICSDNLGALEALREDLQDSFERGHPDRLPDEIVEDLRTYVATRDIDFRLSFESAVLSGGGFDNVSRYVQAMMRHEIAAFPVVVDPDGGGYSMRTILQLLPWEPVEAAVRQVLPAGLPGFGTSMEIVHGPTPAGGLPHPIFDHLSAQMEKTYPEFDHGPLFVPWAATDARFFRSAGIPAFGFSPFLVLTGDANKITGPNERLVLPSFVAGVELLEEIVRTWVQ